MNKSIDEIKEKMLKDRNRKGPSLLISRVPPNVLKAFMALAKEAFCDDYGMTLMHLMDVAFDERFIILNEKIEELERKINMLEGNKEERTNFKGEKIVGVGKND